MGNPPDDTVLKQQRPGLAFLTFALHIWPPNKQQAVDF